MKIELDHSGPGNNRIESYAEGRVTVAGEEYSSSIVITPTAIHPDWPPNHFSELERSHIEFIQSFSPEVLILGTGEQLLFPEQEIVSPLLENQTGYEVMDTGAACRSFNFLLGEGRVVVAALFMI